VLNTTSGSVVGAVAVGHDPQGITYDSSNQLLYVANYRGNSVSVIDTRTDSVIANVSPVTSPYRVLYNPVAQDVLVLSSNLTSVQPQSPSLYVISTSSESVVSTSNLGIDPIDAAFDPDNSRIYVADAPNFVTPAANSIVTLDAQTNTPIGNLSTGFGTNYLSYDAANKRLIMLDSSEGGLSVFNPTTGTVLHRIPIAIAGAPDFVFDPINSNLYTTGCYLGCQGSMLYSFSPTGISEYQLGTYADSTGEDTQVIALDTSSGLLYITDGFSAGVTVFDPSTGETVGRLAFSGYTPYYNFFEAATYDPSSGLLYIVDSPGSGDGSLIAVNVTSGLITKTLNLGTALTGIIYDRANGDLYVEGASVLNVVDGQKDSLLGKISLPGTAPNGNPYTMVLDPTSTVIYALVSESVGKSDVMIATISTATNSVSGTVDVSTLAGSGIFNGYPALDPQNGYLYLALDTANDVGEVAVLNLGSGALVDTIPVGLFPYGGAYDPSNGEIYVGGAYGMISVIQTPFSGVTTSSTTTTTSSTPRPQHRRNHPRRPRLRPPPRRR
jgi:YVTN family beta-propeller protein